MKMVIVAVALILVIVVAGVLYEQGVQDKQKAAVVALVDGASQLISEKGVQAFPELRTAPWVNGDLYVFVWQMDGIRVVYPPDASGEGKNMSSLKDSTGKPIGQLFIQTAQNGTGWVEYIWPKPNATQPSQKITYIKRVDYQNRSYLVGSGIYV
jgi:cytochrome c